MQLSENELDLIAWTALSEPGDALANLLWTTIGPKVLEHAKSGDFKPWFRAVGKSHPEYLPEVKPAIERISLRLPTVNPHQLVERGIRWNCKPVSLDKLPQTRTRFSDLGLHAPLMLWVAGNEQLLEQEQVAIVGTRTPSRTGIENCRRLVDLLNMPVVSGGAKGVDATAHEQALKAGLPTVAVMAGGIDRAYPVENWNLFHRIVRSNGALVSEMPPGVQPSRFRFLQRNRLIAAMCSELFVVEAALRSGSRNTANHAKRLNRDVYALAGSWDNKMSQGCNSMIQQGLANQFPLGGYLELEPSWQAKRIEDAIRNGASTIHEIASESGVAHREVERFRQRSSESRTLT
ncbi:MAG: DNA-processing protein DprA [Aquiluna sp.]|nr:DNA-processing protein DprA [Aquiluna sp.]